MDDSPSPDRRETARYVAIRRLQDAYADVVTRRAWAELAELFLADAVVEVDKREGEPLRLAGPDAIGAFIGTAIAGFDFFEFVVLNGLVDLSGDGDAGDRARGRVYLCELRQDAATGRFSVAYGVYHDEYRRVEGRWWIAGRRYHSLARTSTSGERALDVFGFPHHLASGS